MKAIKYCITSLVAIMLFYGCDQGIDGITEVDPGPDASAPQIKINSPADGLSLKVNEELTSVPIRFEATDDIELGSVRVIMDGTQIASYSSFKDYRRFIVEDLIYDGIDDGTHEFAVSATDLDGKTTTETTTFVKEPAYIPKYAGELLYVPFDGDYTDLISFEKPTVEGNPGFTDESLNGPSAYAGAADSYLTFSTDRFKNAEFSAIFWLKINAVPDRAGVLIMGPPLNDTGGNDLTKGFRFFRENAGGMQRFKLNVGSGDSGTWFDGGEAADVDPAADKWVNMAFTISNTEAVVYIDGEIVTEGPLIGGVDWTDCNVLSIMSGAPNFTGWNHWSDESYMDDLRVFDRAITQEEVRTIIQDDSGVAPPLYDATFDGEMFYMPFDGDYKNLFTDTEATIEGSPGFAGESAAGSDAYVGATDSYLTFPTNGLTTNQFSATMWYKINADPDRAGILVMGPPMINDGADNDLTKGFRFFRENAGGNQRFKLNVGSGAGGTWFDGGEAADVNPATEEWIHLAFTISDTEAVVYIDGEIVSQGAFDGVDWTDCDVLSIMSGAPNFTGWNHWSDLSLIDELRLYDKALTQEEVQNIRDSDL
ncbi:LamG domain-containing protein [Ulvibacterium marinum]|uniref:LamG domain-containing protein n=1 Tax=Ulvibacterium marinum TaxID=2419782 RepID=A0A3B0C4A9_9FLAO|nr:LamG domain-containing protein [Ulvibacterium marinum]RKN79331.1 LamG domain-containing protein [Ulvibacterium marinum]